MLKMRIQHLLEEKSNREHRNLTMEDLSGATGISRSALYKMNSDPGYNPSKEVMEKLVNYFRCSLDDLFDRTTKVSFDMSSTFPKDEDFSAMVLCLLAASNDLVFLRKLLVKYNNEDDAGIVTKMIRASEANFIFFLCLGFLREGMKIFRQLLQDKTANKLFDRMNKDGKKALQALKHETDGDHSLYTTVLIPLRSEVIFHYLKTSFSRALKSTAQSKGDFIIGQTHAESRYLIADDIRGEIFRAFVNFDADGEHDKETWGKLISIMGHFTTFTSHFSFEYLKFRKGPNPLLTD